MNKIWVCPCFGVCRVHLEVFAEERGLDLKTLLLCLGSDERFSKTLKEPYGLETKQNRNTKMIIYESNMFHCYDLLREDS